MILKPLQSIIIFLLFAIKLIKPQDEERTVYKWIETPYNRTILEGLSLNDKLQKWSNLNSTYLHQIRDEDFLEGTCGDERSRPEILTAILKTVNFYEKHIDRFPVVDLDIASGLLVLQGILDVRGILPELSSRIRPLIDKILQLYVNTVHDERIKSELLELFSHKDLWKSNITWKSPNDLKSQTVPKVGNEVDAFWPPLFMECQFALINRCEVPHLCERTFLDKEPQSQRMLIHQALYLHFARKRSCDSVHPQLFSNLDERVVAQCAKMFQEAKLIADHEFPAWGRDLFAEYIFICGRAGYSNFLRRDWISTVLSWQSPISGCTVNKDLNPKYLNYDRDIVVVGSESEKEKCLFHQTATTLTSLAVQWAWFFDKHRCNSHLQNSSN